MTGYRFVYEHSDSHPVSRLCRTVGVNRSGYRKWRGRPPSARDEADAELLTAIRAVHEQSRSTYGAPRVHGQLRRRGVRVGRKRVARLMRDAGLAGVGGRREKRRRPPAAAAAAAASADLVDRDFTAKRPNELWVADITEFDTAEGKLHLAGVLDACTQKLVGWSMSRRAAADLVIDAVAMAVQRQQVEGPLTHHSDKGTQYTSLAFTNSLRAHGVVASYGSTGDCYDNARMESFWATLKRELAWIHGTGRFPTRAGLRAAVFDYIEVFYNRGRHQARLEHLTPTEYESHVTAA